MLVFRNAPGLHRYYLPLMVSRGKRSKVPGATIAFISNEIKFWYMHDARTPCPLIVTFVVSPKFPKEGSPVPIPRNIESLPHAVEH